MKDEIRKTMKAAKIVIPVVFKEGYKGALMTAVGLFPVFAVISFVTSFLLRNEA